jgi:2,6-dihydroxypyridine 3-monooxygenase
MSAPRVIIAGGSLGGLTAALTLLDAGCDVTVCERAAAPLAGLGAGIVLNPVTVRYLVERGGVDLRTISIASNAVRYMGVDGAIVHSKPFPYRFSSYNALYRGLRDRLAPERYRLGTAVTGCEHTADAIYAQLADGTAERADLLVWADGIRSTGRRQLLPNAELQYAGYVAWRGTVGTGEIGAAAAQFADAITYHVLPHGHMLVYPIPVVDRDGADETQLNWLWYRNVPLGAELDAVLTDAAGNRREVSVPAGAVAEAQLAELRSSAAQQLPPPLSELIHATAQPFIQAIIDLELPQMAFGRACLIGDAAFVARPHAAAGTAKAAADAWTLSEAVAAAVGNMPAALARWEPGQLALGRSVLERTRAAGIRAQFSGTWRVGDDLPFGLYTTGDSAMEITT